MHEAADQLQRAVAEGELRTARRAEQVRGQPEFRSRHVREEQRGAARRDDAAVNLRHFETRVHWSVHRHQVAIATQAIDERTKITE